MRILAINPGSTSTKIAVYENEKEVWVHKLSHSPEELAPFGTAIFDQYSFRYGVIARAVEEAGFPLESLDGVVGRGGLVKPVHGGTYIVDEGLMADLKAGIMGQHASNLGGAIAWELARKAECDAYIVDPVVVDELEPIARYSGSPLLPRTSIFHALNQKAVARKAAAELNREYRDCRFIVAHMGGGISVGAHLNGQVIDVNNALDGEGPFTPERSGTLPAGALAKLCFSGKYTLDQVKKIIKGSGGIVAYLGTNDMLQVAKEIEAGNSQWLEVYQAMAYQISKEIGSMAVVLRGNVDAILVTGGIAWDKKFVGWIKEATSFIAEMKVYPGEMEMEALALGALRVLQGKEEPRTYNP
ncbi:butyrate kinase [Candidatus Fermentibacteria bacterium]|nr:MAG: butyrate kinase [Candidatus Fermentibacteria bacterium]